MRLSDSLERNRIQLLLTSVGLVVALLLVLQEYSIEANGCIGLAVENLGQNINCQSVLSFDPLKLLGLNSSIVGAIYFVFLFVLINTSLFIESKNLNNFKRLYIVLGFLNMTILTTYHLLFIDGICMYCIFVYIVLVFLFFLEIYKKERVLESYRYQYISISILIIVLPFFLNSQVQDNLEFVLRDSCATEVLLTTDEYQDVIESNFIKGASSDEGGTVVFYFSITCEHCKAFFPDFIEIMDQEASDMQFVFQPVMVNPENDYLFNAIHLANEQDKFLEILYLAMNTDIESGIYSKQIVNEYLDYLDLNEEENLDKIDNGYYSQIISNQRETAIRVGIRHFPTIVLNRAILSNYNSIKSCTEML